MTSDVAEELRRAMAAKDAVAVKALAETLSVQKPLRHI
jgi:hypothetical protein